MFEFPLVAVLIIVALIFAYINLVNNKAKSKRNGKIEIKFTEIDDGDEANTIKHTDLILEIRYRLINGSRYNKEETAILINELVQNKCKLRGFRIRDNTKKTLKEIKGIMEIIKPLLPRETYSELIDTNYRISKKIIPRWSKDVFVKV